MTQKQQERENKTYQALRRLPAKQFLFIIAGILIIAAVLILSSVIQIRAAHKDIKVLESELTALKSLNAASEPICWENRDSQRILRDYGEIERVYKKIFTFRTLDDMVCARKQASEFGLGSETLNMLYDPNEILSQDVILEAESASFIDCYYSDSDIFLIGIYDGFYRYLSRVSLDVLADYNITLILLLDADESGHIINDACYISSLPAETLFRRN